MLTEFGFKYIGHSVRIVTNSFRMMENPGSEHLGFSFFIGILYNFHQVYRSRLLFMTVLWPGHEEKIDFLLARIEKSVFIRPNYALFSTE